MHASSSASSFLSPMLLRRGLTDSSSQQQIPPTPLPQQDGNKHFHKQLPIVRKGLVLDGNSLLKIDSFPQVGEENNLHSDGWFPLRISGAENFRSVRGTGIWGLSQPTLHGIRGVLNCLGASRNGIPHEYDASSMLEPTIITTEGATISQQLPTKRNKVLWINLREEPGLFINGRCVVLRDVTQPFHNIEAIRGINDVRLRELEHRFKEDVIAEATQFGGNVLLHEERIVNVLQEVWESVPSESIMTAEEVFFKLRTEGYRVQYARIPTTSGRTPNYAFFDDLCKCIITLADRETWIVVNCQTGVARSTFAMVLAGILQTKRGYIREDSLLRNFDLLKKRKSETFTTLEGQENVAESEMKAGWYAGVVRMVRLIAMNGRDAKANADRMIDLCAHITNLRLEVYHLRMIASNMRASSAVRFSLKKALVSLKRYLLCILFEAYVSEQFVSLDTQSKLYETAKPSNPQSFEDETNDVPASSRRFYNSSPEKSEFKLHFTEWLSDRAEILSMLKSIDGDSLRSASASLQGGEQQDDEGHSVQATRRGTMLNTDTILKLDSYFISDSANATPSAPQQLPGVYNFRQVEGLPIFGVCTLFVESARGLIRYLERNNGESNKTIHFVNLREEPVIYINDRPFVLRSEETPFRNIHGFLNISAERLEQVEMKLKEDVINEVRRCGGKVLIHCEKDKQMANGLVLKAEWEEVEDAEVNVETPKDVWARLKREGFHHVNYSRIPLTPEAVPSANDVDEIVSLVRREKESQMVFFCQQGKGRSTLATIVAALEVKKFHEFSDETERAEEGVVIPSRATTPMVHDGEYTPILSLMRLLKQGNQVKRWLDAMIDRCGAVVNIRESIGFNVLKAAKARDNEEATPFVENAMLDLKRYFYLLCVAAYQVNGKEKTFSEWLSIRPEISTIYEEEVNKDVLLKGQPGGGGSDNGLDNDELLHVLKRHGSVLVKGSILKTDHFPGCKRLSNPEVDLEGAPNFRSVYFKELKIHGTGIPTKVGLESILNYLDKDAVLWINLREEPIIYINGRPFVLRKLDHPFSNLEYTGISKSRVEDMELRMKDDVLREVANNNNSVLIHEESEDGTLHPRWEVVEEVKTPKELFTSCLLSASEANSYVRIPITDEQAPKPVSFDAIVDSILSAKSGVEKTHIVINCQMGRGRTTTGLVIASALKLALKNQLLGFDKQLLVKAPNLGMKFRSRLRNKSVDAGEALTLKELNGDYNAVTIQARLLEKGVDAKIAMDGVIDMCDAMQNLREAIYDLKLKAFSHDLTPQVRAQNFGIAVHYLRRYVQLIQFAAYVSTLDSFDSSRRVRFANWLKQRQELSNSFKDERTLFSM